MTKKMLLSGSILLMLALVGYRFAELSVQAVVTEAPPVTVNVRQMKPEPLSTWVFSEGFAEALHKAWLIFDHPDNVVYIGKMEDGTDIREGSRVFGPGNELNKGQLLARIDNRESSAQVEALEAQLQSALARKKGAEATLARAENELNQIRLNFQRMEKIHSKGALSQDEFERTTTKLKNAETDLETAVSHLGAATQQIREIAASLNQATIKLEKNSLFAPFDGVITTMNIRQGSYYYPPTSSTANASGNKDREASSAIVITDDRHYEIQLEITESEALNVREGQTVYVAANDRTLYQARDHQFSNGMNSEFARGTVWSVSPSLSLQKRSRRVKVRVMGTPLLHDGLFVHAWIQTSSTPDTLTLPWSHLSYHDGLPFVYVVNQDQKATRRWLELGREMMDQVEVLNGLAVDELVVIRGQHRLNNGSRVKILKGS